MEILLNPHRGPGLTAPDRLARGPVMTDPSRPLSLLERCPAAAATPLLDLPGAAQALGVGRLWAKDETARMGLGSFKALGAAYAVAERAIDRAGDGDASQALAGVVYACASAGNHGLSVAVGAHLFGARAVIYLGDGVPEAFADRLRARAITACQWRSARTCSVRGRSSTSVTACPRHSPTACARVQPKSCVPAGTTRRS